MYLSQLILNPRSRRVQKEIASPYQMHRSLMRAFPDNLLPDEERVLFRLDNHRRTNRLTLLVQSWTLPDWSWLAEPDARGYLLPVGEPNLAVKSFDLQLSLGQALAFRLRANPAVKRKFDDGAHKRVGLYREEEQINWLMRKAKQSGFRVISAYISSDQIVHDVIHRNEEGKKHDLKLLAVRFDGLLGVVNPDQLREAVRNGIGSGKALGFGLLSLAPAQA